MTKVIKLDLSYQFLCLENSLHTKLMQLKYGTKVAYIYNPLDYAEELHKDYVTKYCRAEKEVLIIGMNPGPWGMCQTGVPFGEVTHIKNWLKIKGDIKKPTKEHPKRPVEGLNCKRKEISGDRFWGLLQELSGEPDILFRHTFVHNYCPLAFLGESGKNITPCELKIKEREALEALCDESLIETLTLLNVKHLICVGNYVLQKARKALSKAQLDSVQVSLLMHPSPANPEANKRWKEVALHQLKEADVLHYFGSSKSHESTS